IEDPTKASTLVQPKVTGKYTLRSPSPKAQEQQNWLCFTFFKNGSAAPAAVVIFPNALMESQPAEFSLGNGLQTNPPGDSSFPRCDMYPTLISSDPRGRSNRGVNRRTAEGDRKYTLRSPSPKAQEQQNWLCFI